LALPWPCDVALRGDALTLLRSLPDGCTPLVFFDPHRCDPLALMRIRPFVELVTATQRARP
jgi:hypothetical protein